MWQLSYRPGWNIYHLLTTEETSYIIEDIANSSIRHAALEAQWILERIFQRHVVQNSTEGAEHELITSL